VIHRPIAVVIPAKAGIQYAAASRSIISVSGILDRPVKPDDDSEGLGSSFALVAMTFPRLAMTPRSRGADRAQVVVQATLESKRAQGKPGAQCTRSLAGNKKSTPAKSLQVRRNNPTFPAQWFTAYNALSPVTGLFCHRRLRFLSQT
jgi:hypothetical protein